MSGPAFKKVLEDRQEECNSRTLVTAPNRMGTVMEGPEVFAKGLHQVSGGGFYNIGSEDEAVEHLLTELVPEYIDAVRNVLQFDAFSLYNCFGTGPLSQTDNRHPESSADNPNISNMMHEKATGKLSDVKSEGNSEGHHTMSSASNDLPDTYEDYLLDAEYLECVTDMNPVPSRGRSTENLNLDQYGDLGLSHCNVMYEGWCTSSKLVSEPNEKSFSPDKMTVDEGILVASKRDMIMTSASSPLTGVFNFRTKPRSRHMRRYKHTNSSYLNTFSVEDTCFLSSVPDTKEKVIVNVIRGKSKPLQRCTSRSIAKSSRFSSRTCEYSAVSKDMIQPKPSVRRCHREGLRPRVLIHGSGKKSSEADSTGVLSGAPLDVQTSMEKGNEFEDSADSVSAGSDVDFNVGLCSVESQETSSEGSFLSAAKTQKSNNSKRQRHIPWSLEEVIQLIDGVSKHGVGKWTDIKRVSFPSSPHRSAVDLKDKWRNLVRASCRFSERKKRAGKGRYCETQYIPDDIMHRVKELSCIYPYPRERNFKVSRNVGFSANISAQNCDNFMPFSMTVKV